MALTINLTSPANGATGIEDPYVLQFTCSGDEPSQTAELYINGDFNRTKSGLLSGLQATSPVGGLEDNTTYTWQIRGFKENPSPPPATVEVWSDGPWSFTTGGVPAKATNPTPTNGQSGFAYDDTLSWDDGGGANTFSVYIGNSEGVTRVSFNQAGETYNLTAEDKASFFDAICYWRIDSINGDGTTTGDTWTFDARPSKPITPTPSNAVSNIILSYPSLTWVTGGYTTTYNLSFGTTSGDLPSIDTGFEPVTYGMPGDVLAYIITYYWRVDATNSYGTTTGDEWSFTTIRLKPPGPTYQYGGFYYQLLVDEDGNWGTPPPVGVENTDYVVVTYLPNFISTTRRLIGVANNKVWFEDI